MAYFAWQLWGELYPALRDGIDYPRPVPLSAAPDGTEARASIFYIFAVALAGPVILLVGYVAIGFVYNLVVGSLTRHIPLSRFAIVPLVLLLLFTTLQSRRDEVKDGISDGWALVEQRIGSAKSLQLQNSGASARTLEQLRRQYDELPALEEVTAEPPDMTMDNSSEQLTPEVARRQLEELLQQLHELQVAAPLDSGRAPR